MSDTYSPRPGSRVFMRAARLLGRVESRLVLSVAIIVSLLPFEWVPALDGAFLLLFSLEFVLRSLLIFRGESQHVHTGKPRFPPSEAELQEQRGWQWPSTGTLVLLLLDLLALLSFVPTLLPDSFGLTDAETRWLRLFRLSRMALLLSYWAPLLRDVWAVLLRQERAKQVALMGLIVLALSFGGAVVIDQLRVGDDTEIDFDGDQIHGLDESGQPADPDDERFAVHLWWAFRQIQDPGNMLASPEQAVAVVVSVGLTIFGLFMVSFLIGLGTDVVRELMELSRLRPPGLHGHTILVNVDPSTQRLLHELIRYSRKLLPGGALSLGWVAELLRNTKRGLQGGSYLLVGRSHDPPDFLRQPDLARVAYRQVQVDDEAFMQRTDVFEAQRVVLLADLDTEDPDAATIQALLTITSGLREADQANERRASSFGPDGSRRRARLLIAEVLDESNIPAARAAITGGEGGHMRAFVVPTERLIALFIACIARRPGVGRLLEELLTSHGHELYTLFFDLGGLGYRRECRPPLSNDPGEVMAELIRRARSMGAASRVIPVGVLMAGCRGADEIIVHINPEPDFESLGGAVIESAASDAADAPAGGEVEASPMPEQGAALVEERPLDASSARSLTGLRVATDGECQCLGFIAIADNFGRVRNLADDFYQRPREQLPSEVRVESDARLCRFECAPTAKLRRVLVCGFRSATVSMVESLIQTEPHAQVLIMVRDEDAREAAFDDFDAHTKLVERGLLGDHHGRFEADREQHTLTWIGDESDPARVHVRIVTGDWSSSRQLLSLPLGFGHVGSMDAVFLISSEADGSDARTAKTLMKLETLTDAPRIVAEVLDAELARRLRRRNTERGSDRVRVYSIQELRSFFMFQSVVVPAFDLVYTELMGPWGESFVRLLPAPEGERLTGTCSFEALANHLSADARVLVGVQLCEEPNAITHQHGPGCRTSLHVAETGGPGDIELARLVEVWVVSRDR